MGPLWMSHIKLGCSVTWHLRWGGVKGQVWAVMSGQGDVRSFTEHVSSQAQHIKTGRCSSLSPDQSPFQSSSSSLSHGEQDDLLPTLFLSQTTKKKHSPKAGHHATKEEHAVALNKGRQEGEETVDSHGDQQALFTTHFVWKPAPEEGSEHHPQIYNATWSQGQRQGGRVKQPKNNTQNWPTLFLSLKHSVNIPNVMVAGPGNCFLHCFSNDENFTVALLAFFGAILTPEGITWLFSS